MKPTRCETIRRDVEQAISAHPNASSRVIACEVGVSELELLLARMEVSLWPLQARWPELLKAFPSLGKVRCTTSNEAGEHVREGVFEQIAFYGEIGVVLGEAIDLRLLMEHWRYGYAVVEAGTGEASFRFFDAHGLAILQVTLDHPSEAFGSLVATFSDTRVEWPVLAPLMPPPPDRLEAEVDLAAFHSGWMKLEDTAYFSDLLKQFGLRREQGLRLAPPGHSWRVERAALLDLLHAVRTSRLRIMIFMRSSGCLQIHTGRVDSLDLQDEVHLELRDTGFRFTLDLSLVASCWIVRKPTLDGVITSMELFDIEGNNLALLFGKRGYGQPEDPNWRDLLGRLVPPG